MKQRYRVRVSVMVAAENASQAKTLVANLFNAAAYRHENDGRMIARITSANLEKPVTKIGTR